MEHLMNQTTTRAAQRGMSDIERAELLRLTERADELGAEYGFTTQLAVSAGGWRVTFTDEGNGETFASAEAEKADAAFAAALEALAPEIGIDWCVDCLGERCGSCCEPVPYEGPSYAERADADARMYRELK